MPLAMSRARIARNATYAVAQVVLTGILLLATYWLMMRELTVAQIGLWSLVVGSTMVARLSEIGLGTSVLRFVAGDLAADKPDHAARTVAMATTAATLLVGTLALAAQPFLHSYLLRITPAEMHGSIGVLLPAAILALVLGTAGNVLINAIDGCQRIDLRARLQVSSGVVQLVATWFVLPRWGLDGLGLVQVAQAAFLLCAAAVVLARLLGRPLRDYTGFDRTRLRELMVFGGGYQLSVMVMLLFEPLIRVLLTMYSGLTLTGYFEMASRIVSRFSGVVASAFSALTPHVAAQSLANTNSTEKIRRIYNEVFSLLLLLLLPYFACLAAAMGLLLTVWKGTFDQLFLVVALLQLWAWLGKLLSVPAYMIYLGTGRLRWNIASQVATGLLLIVLGFPLGELFGGAGVLVAGVIALGGGAQLSTIGLLSENAIGIDELASAGNFPGLLLLVGATAASTYLAQWQGVPGWTILIGLPTVVGLGALAIVLPDPRCRKFLAHIP